MLKFVVCVCISMAVSTGTDWRRRIVACTRGTVHQRTSDLHRSSTTWLEVTVCTRI